MADIGSKGAELKALVAMARKRAVYFAYCPGNDVKEDVFAMDRKKKPAALARDAKVEGTGSKVCFGSASVSGKVMSLTCIKEIPQVAKRLKKFLKSEKVKLNVVVLDESGNVLEEDVEVFEDDGTSDEGNGAADAVATEPAAADVGGDAPEAKARDAKADMLKAIKARAAAVQAAIQEKPATVQGPLVKAFKGVIAALKSGDLATAEAVLTKIERALDSMPAADRAAEATDEKAGVWKKARSVFEPTILELLPLGFGDMGKMRAVWAFFIEKGEAGDFAGALKAVPGLKKLIADAQAARAASPDADAKDVAPADENTDAEGAAWRDAKADLEPVLLDLLQRGLGDVGKMRAVLAYFNDKGEVGDFAGAMKAVPGMKKLIADGRAAEQTVAEQDIPSNVVPFVRARLDWSNTRATLRSEMTKLQAAIVTTCPAEEFPTIEADSKALFSYLEKLDSRLEDALEALVQEPDGDTRERLKGNARKILGEFQSELDTPFFKAVDGSNGFKPVNVRGAAIASLDKVNQALSTEAA